MGLSPYLALLSFGACFNGNFQQAYLLSILNQPYLIAQRFINESYVARTGKALDDLYIDFLWSIINVVNPISGIVGQIIAYIICDRIGRRWTAIVSCLISIPALLLSMLTRFLFPYYEALIIGRFLWGTANGIAIVVQTVWIVESAPTSQRGKVNSWQEAVATSGNLLSQAVGVVMSTSTLWSFTFSVPLFVNIICLMIFVMMYESPQYLLIYKNKPKVAMRSIAAYHGLHDDIEILKQLRKCEDDGKKKESPKFEDEKEYSGMEIMFMPWKANDSFSIVIRQGAWIGIMVKIAYVFTGARVIRSFNTFIYHGLGKWSENFAQWGSLVNTIIRLPLSIIPIFIIEKVGRRPLMVISQLASVLTLSIIMISVFIGERAKIGTLLGVSLLLFATSLGIGSISRFYSAELVPKNMLLRTVTVLSLIESSTKIALDFGFYPIAATNGAYAFLLFLIPSFIFLFMMIRYCPETKQRSVNVILNEMAVRLKVDAVFKV
ncbi:unnamed protein product [Dracunculus medinensis]|uniref:MFS domain-containing protein n=1 Tax=Dracunculus medinensis TaxID=318479 RepID=A0A0N4UNQ1_DRAME|nr:unnamed protein product [Dracunculus medinensis]